MQYQRDEKQAEEFCKLRVAKESAKPEICENCKPLNKGKCKVCACEYPYIKYLGENYCYNCKKPLE